MVANVKILAPLHRATEALQIVFCDREVATMFLAGLAWVHVRRIHLPDTSSVEELKPSFGSSGDLRQKLAPTSKKNRLLEDEASKTVSMSRDQVYHVVYFEVEAFEQGDAT